MIHKKELLNKVSTYIVNSNDLSKIEKACDFAIKAHGSQLRHSGDPYYHHPIAVASILADMKLDIASIITALLHDTVEDTEVTLEVIGQEFGEEISKLVDGVTKLTKIEFQPDHVRQAENFRKLLVAMSEDIRVLIVKLADRLHNMRTLSHVKLKEKRLKQSHETMEIYAPLAERIGIQKFKNELQDLAFAELHPEARASIINRLSFLRKNGDEVIEKIELDIKEKISQTGINATVVGREKTPCSIWHKMEQKNISFEQLSDIMAFRIIVQTLPECYQALGIIHSNYHMVPDSFKDFISTPKANGYRSIHTIVIGPDQNRIEVQIRTAEMHEIAELGVAAHWSYKQNRDYSIDGKQYRWLRELLSILEHASDSEEFLENTKLEMYYDQVFCFTPKGNVIALPKGSTPVDFAYALHSDIGNSCSGAKVNGRIVPLRIELKNGDQVEIIRSKHHHPSPIWEKFVVTGKARSEIRKYIRLEQRQEYINLGKAIAAKALKVDTTELNEKKISKALEFFKKKSLEELFISIGEGRISKIDLIKAINPNEVIDNDTSIKSKFSFLRFRNKEKKDQAVSLKGLIPGMAMHFAGCCHPIPGDKIVGIVHSGRGVTIHTSDCEMLENFSNTPERWLDIAWDKEASDTKHIARLKAVVSHETGTLATLTNTIAKDDGNITNLKIVSRSEDFFEIIIDVEVKGVKHLANIIGSLRSKNCIHAIERFKL